MLKKIIKGMLIGGLILGLAGSAAAADYEVNIFGASAQFEYWIDGAPKFLDSTDVDCDDAAIYHARGELDDRESGISICHYNTSILDDSGVAITARLTPGSTVYNDDVIIRYSTFASAEGLLAAREENPSNADNPPCTSPDERLMADEATTWFTLVTWENREVLPGVFVKCPVELAEPDVFAGVKSHKCVDVTLGTADIDPECFTQTTRGFDKWDHFDPNDPEYSATWCKLGDPNKWTGTHADWWTRIFTPNNPLPPTPWTGMDKENPFVVPFAFFRNNTSGKAVTEINNITKAMGGMLFEGRVAKWNRFEHVDTDKKVMLCIRHAGSGTHATLQWSVMMPEYPNLVQNAKHPGATLQAAGFAPSVITNKGSTDEIECVGFNGGLDSCAAQSAHTWAAIGYADADKLNGDLLAAGENCVDNCVEYSGSKGESCRLCYEGYEATYDNVKDCLYAFWGANAVYYQTVEVTAGGLADDLLAFSAVRANQCSHAGFWVPQDDMQCERADCKSPIIPK